METIQNQNELEKPQLHSIATDALIFVKKHGDDFPKFLCDCKLDDREDIERYLFVEKFIPFDDELKDFKDKKTLVNELRNKLTKSGSFSSDNINNIINNEESWPKSLKNIQDKAQDLWNTIKQGPHGPATYESDNRIANQVTELANVMSTLIQLIVPNFHK